MKDKYNFKKNDSSSIAWWCFWPGLVYLGISLVIGAIFGIFYGVYLGMNGIIEFEDIMSELAKVIMPVNIVTQVLGVAVYLPVFLHMKKKALPKVTKKVKWSTWIWSLLFFLGISVLSDQIIQLISKVFFSEGSSLDMITEMIMGGSLWAAIISTVIMAPFMEELMVRGLSLNKLLSGTDTKKAIIISAVIFGVIHLNLLQGLNAFVLGIILAMIYIKTRSIILCMVCHAANNLLACVSSYWIMNEVANAVMMNNIINVALLLLGVVGGYFYFKSEDAVIEKNES